MIARLIKPATPSAQAPATNRSPAPVASRAPAPIKGGAVVPATGRSIIPQAAPPMAAASIDSTIAKVRAANGRAERRQVIYTCSVDRQSFTANFERTDPRARFKCASTEKHDASNGYGASRKATSTGAAQTPQGGFHADDFDISTLVCPYCNARKGSIYHHECETAYCGGRRWTNAQGGGMFECPTCRESFPTASFDSVFGKTAETARRQEPGTPVQTTNLLGRGPQTFLPKQRK
jgi:hypothetical protein